MIRADVNGAVNWVDLSSPDVAASSSFYRNLLGWSVSTTTTDLGDYHLASIDDHEVGGMMAHPPEMEGAPALWTVFVGVDDVEVTLARVEAAGGTVVQAGMDIPGGARVGVFTDPTGAMLAVISGGPPADGTYYSDTPGAVCWVELLTRDTESAASFHAEVFGWESSTETGGGTTYTTFRIDGEDVGGMMTIPDEAPADAPAHWATYFSVADCEAAAAAALDLGGRALVPPTTIDLGTFAVLADPQGATFHVMQSNPD